MWKRAHMYTHTHCPTKSSPQKSVETAVILWLLRSIVWSRWVVWSAACEQSGVILPGALNVELSCMSEHQCPLPFQYSATSHDYLNSETTELNSLTRSSTNNTHFCVWISMTGGAAILLQSGWNFFCTSWWVFTLSLYYMERTCICLLVLMYFPLPFIAYWHRIYQFVLYIYAHPALTSHMQLKGSVHHLIALLKGNSSHSYLVVFFETFAMI